MTDYYIQPVKRIEDRLEDFFIYHTRHPRTYVLFCHFVDKLRDRGFENYSVDAIFHAIRWHTDLEADPEEEAYYFIEEPEELPRFKISAVWRIFYGRLWTQDHLGWEHFFRTRITNEVRKMDVKGLYQAWLASHIPTPEDIP